MFGHLVNIVFGTNYQLTSAIHLAEQVRLRSD